MRSRMVIRPPACWRFTRSGPPSSSARLSRRRSSSISDCQLMAGILRQGRAATMEVGPRLPRARGGEDRVLLPRAAHELQADGQALRREAPRHTDGGEARRVADGAEQGREAAPDGAPEPGAQTRAG